jgi:1-deoxy-D-xylulose-5-phosphate synthase
MLTTALACESPAAVRYPRGAGPGAPIDAEIRPLPIGRGEIRRNSKARPGHRVALLAFGSMVPAALAAADEFDATVANMRFVKPLDVALVQQLARSHDALVTIEENAVIGGAGSAVLEALAAAGLAVPVLQLGLPDRFVDHGDPALLLKECGLDRAGISESVRTRFGALLAAERRTTVG